MLYYSLTAVHSKKQEAKRLKPWIKALRELSWLTQLGLTLIIPPLLCIGAAWFLTDKLNAPVWVMLPAFILGFGGSAVSFYKFYQYTMRKAGKGQKPPPAFNDHQ